MNDFDAIRGALLGAMEQQYATDIEALNTTQRVKQQQLAYSNEARGTLYSGQPTWERAQLAASGATNLAKIQSDYLKNRLNVWDNITKTVDQINSYNKAAAAMAKAASNVSGGGSTSTSYLDFYKSLTGAE